MLDGDVGASETKERSRQQSKNKKKWPKTFMKEKIGVGK